jgi:hypothetical protein
VSESDVITCRICGCEKQAHQFCCRACFLRLPHELRHEFVLLKFRCINWLRKNPTTRQPAGHPQPRPARQLDDALDREQLRDGITGTVHEPFDHNLDE